MRERLKPTTMDKYTKGTTPTEAECFSCHGELKPGDTVHVYDSSHMKLCDTCFNKALERWNALGFKGQLNGRRETIADANGMPVPLAVEKIAGDLT